MYSLAKLEFGEVEESGAHEVVLQPPVVIEHLENEQMFRGSERAAEPEATHFSSVMFWYAAGRKTKETKEKNDGFQVLMYSQTIFFLRLIKGQ